MSFKLLAIRPLTGCNPKFLKNLEENRIYQIYNDYEFLTDNDEPITKFGKDNYFEVKKIKHTPTVPENFFGNEKQNINISAIVGKNGSGKSSLVELLYVALYNLAVVNDIIKNNIIKYKNEIKENFNKGVLEFKIQKEKANEILELIENLSEPNKFFSEDYKNDFLNNLSLLNRILNYESLKKDFEKYNTNNSYVGNSIKYLKEYEIAINNQAYYIEDIKYEIYFEVEGKILKLTETKDSKDIFFQKYEDKSKVKSYLLNQDKLQFDINENIYKLFYNIVVNYSLYGLNSNEVGKWIESIFHKNDGYQTPIVINPMRTNGKIDINRENQLVRDRLMCNAILNPKFRDITTVNKITNLLVTKKKNYKVQHTIEKCSDKIFEKIIEDLKQIIESKNNIKIQLKPERNEINQKCIEYIINKLNKIINNYSEIYSSYIFIDEKEIDFEKMFVFLNHLIDDKSHISLKIWQTINFIYLNCINEDSIYSKLKTNYKDEFRIKIPFEEFSKELDERQNEYKIEMIELLPPPIFEIDYIFNEDDNNMFSMLSSGEKQQIFSINSILYHLINLNSTEGNSYPYKYPYINLILDEIELYAHPEMQRKYINDLLDGIKKLDVPNIKALNILFITHSPFILSDIPKQNVLFLEVGEDKKAKPIEYTQKNTFAGNVHEMLTEGFFLENTKGEFALSKIKEFLDFYKEQSIKTKEDFDKKEKYFTSLINLVGEDYVRNILTNHLVDLQVHFGNSTFLEVEEDRLRKRLAEIEKLKVKS
jgi:energy-coupling factor transporter ATP-binding protein EcfA2